MGRNILVVEDDRNICDLIHMYLVKEGFDVRIAYDGGKAVEEFKEKEPDLVLLDVMLPVLDGWVTRRYPVHIIHPRQNFVPKSTRALIDHLSETMHDFF